MPSGGHGEIRRDLAQILSFILEVKTHPSSLILRKILSLPLSETQGSINMVKNWYSRTLVQMACS